MKKKLSILIFLTVLIYPFMLHAQNNLRIRFGTYGQQFEIGTTVDVPVYIWTTEAGPYDIGDFCLPLAMLREYFNTDEDHVSCIRGDDTQEWDDVHRGPLHEDHPEGGWDTYSATGWSELGPPYHDELIIGSGNPEAMVAYFRLEIPDDPGLIDDDVNVFQAGPDILDPVQGPANIGDTEGNSIYNIVQYTVYLADFVAPQVCDAGTYQVGEGTGILGNTHDHIDSYCDQGTRFILRDYSRGRNFSDPNNTHPHRDRGCWIQGFYHIMTGVDTEADADIMENDAADWNDGGLQAAGVDAHYYAGLVYDCMYQDLERNSFDGNGMVNIRSVIDSDDTDALNNAFYDPNTRAVHYGPVNIYGWRPFSCCIDLVAHEWGHGITHYTSNLDPDGNAFLPGALCESFSDMFAAYVTSKKVVQPTQEQIWSIGEDHSTTGIPFRRMDEPELRSHPSVYQGPFWYNGNDWNDFIHINCGVPNKMFHLLSVGGYNHHNEGIVVDGVGIDNAMKILLKANEGYWGNYTDFVVGKDGTFRAALECENEDPDLWRGDYTVPLCQAWNAVGVVEPPCGDFTPGDCDHNGTVGQVADYQYLRNWIENNQGDSHLECPIPDLPDGVAWLPMALDVDGNCEVSLRDMQAYSLFLAAGIPLDPVQAFSSCPYYWEP